MPYPTESITNWDTATLTSSSASNVPVYRVEELVWAFDADTLFDPDREVDVAAFPEPCVYREAAIGALSAAGKAWRLAFERAAWQVACLLPTQVLQ